VSRHSDNGHKAAILNTAQQAALCPFCPGLRWQCDFMSFNIGLHEANPDLLQNWQRIARKYTEAFVGCKLYCSRNYTMIDFPNAVLSQYLKLLEKRGVPAVSSAECIKYCRYFLDYCTKYPASISHAE
jgi:hypothetical protein